MSIRFIARDSFNRKAYSLLGISKRDLRRITVNWGGERLVDCHKIAESTGKSEAMVVVTAKKAHLDIQTLDLGESLHDTLKRLKEYCVHEGFMEAKSGHIRWKRGFENNDDNIRRKFNYVCTVFIEILAEKVGVPVWGLKREHFNGVKLEEINQSLGGIYNYYWRKPEVPKDDLVAFILEDLGYPELKYLPVSEQLGVFRMKEYFGWGKLSISAHRYVLEKLAEISGVSAAGLLPKHFDDIVIPEINATLSPLYDYYKALPERGEKDTIVFIKESLGLSYELNSCSLDEQLRILQSYHQIYWDFVPIPTQKHLLEILAQKANCSVWNLTQPDFQQIYIEEIDRTLNGFYCHYQIKPERGEMDNIPFMLGRFGFPSIAEYSIEEQLNIMKKWGKKENTWETFSAGTQRHLLEKLAEKAGVLVWNLKSDHFLKLDLTEIDSTLWSLYNYYVNYPERGNRGVISFMLERLGFGVPPFNPAGRLFASGKAQYPSQSLHLVLQTVRRLVIEWKSLNPGKSITQVSGKELKSILQENPIFSGSVNAIFTNKHFKLSYIELICLAFQHIPLDEIDSLYKKEHPGFLKNYLEPSPMFPNYSKSGSGLRRDSRLIGYYSDRKRDGDLSLLYQVLDLRIKNMGKPESSEEGLFDDKWLQTQKRCLEEIADKIQTKKPLPSPLTYALGLQGTLPDPQPKLAEYKATAGLDLNPAQRHAARLILEESNPLVMVHGPAGSGKTKLLEQVIETMVHSGKKVLYVTPTHTATDVIMKRIAKSDKFRDLPILRLGIKDDKIDKDYAIKYWVGNPDARDAFKRNLQNCRGMLFTGTIAGGVHFLNDPGAEPTRNFLFRDRLINDISDYDVVIIDEASMASKPEVYAALSKAKRGVIIGDHVQLEPFPIDKKIKERLSLNERQVETVERSLLEELMFDNFPHALLDTNYRAINPAMIVLASRIFYDERVKVNQSQENPYFTDSRELRRKRYPRDSLKIIDTSNLPSDRKKEQIVTASGSYYNKYEADLVVEEVKRLLSQSFVQSEIAIITPYSAQVELIKEKLRKADIPGITNEYLKRWVSTFDGFQGDQNKCVIISFVRSNDKKPPETGFVGNYHRVNVGITRAKERMTLIGDWSTLKKTGNGDSKELKLSDKLSLHTRHIFEELEIQTLELEIEGRAVIDKL